MATRTSRLEKPYVETVSREFPKEIVGYWFSLAMRQGALVDDKAGPSYHVYSNVKAWTEAALEFMEGHGIDARLPPIRRILVTRTRRDGHLLETRIQYGDRDDGPTSVIRRLDGDIIQDTYIWIKDGRLYAQVNYFSLKGRA